MAFFLLQVYLHREQCSGRALVTYAMVLPAASCYMLIYEHTMESYLLI